MKFYLDDIAIVAYDAVTPECPNAEGLFQDLLAGKVMLRDLTSPDERSPLQAEYHTSTDRKAQDKSYARFGAKFPLEAFAAWAQKQELDPNSSTTIEIVLHELFHRLTREVPGLFEGRKAECIIGLSTGEPDPIRISQRLLYEKLRGNLTLEPEEERRIEAYLELLGSQPPRSKHLAKDAYNSLVYDSLIRRFGISGACSFVDAACASSLAALMIAVRRLRDGSADVVVSGGVDVGLSLLTLVSFSKLQIFTEGLINPFDAAADGINQGEGAAVFALMRLDAARAAGYKIHGVIRNCDGSSDGVLGGMVEPTEYGQALAYERAYGGVPIRPLTYLECHGTGTSLGDQTELSSTAKFFHPLPPIGSIKANIGHTIGAAGALSLAKSLKIIEHRIIPRLPRFRRLRKGFEHAVPRENLPLAPDEPVRIGISSFGFGGANFHLVLDGYADQIPERPRRTARRNFELVLNGSTEIDLGFVNELFASSRFRLPPLSLPYADPAVLGGMLAVEQITGELRMRPSQKNREKIGVLSTSNCYLQRLFECYERICHLELARRMNPSHERSFLEANPLPGLPITEASFMWALNNLISGRVTKDFDLKGANCNIAGEHASLGMALSYASSLLRASSGAYFILSVDENFDHENFTLHRSKLKAFLVSDLEFALEANLPIISKIDDIRHRRPSHPGEAHA